MESLVVQPNDVQHLQYGIPGMIINKRRTRNPVRYVVRKVMEISAPNFSKAVRCFVLFCFVCCVFCVSFYFLFSFILGVKVCNFFFRLLVSFYDIVE